MNLSDQQIDRYSRQILLDEVGARGQTTFLASRIALVGTGGGLRECVRYLAAAGIGTLTLLGDGQGSEGEDLRGINPDCDLSCEPWPSDAARAASILGAHDLVVLGAVPRAKIENVRAACARAGRPVLWRDRSSVRCGVRYSADGQVPPALEEDGRVGPTADSGAGRSWVPYEALLATTLATAALRVRLGLPSPSTLFECDLLTGEFGKSGADD